MAGDPAGDPVVDVSARTRWRCRLFSHKYIRLRYPGSPDGYYLRCVRCGKENEERGGHGYSGGMSLSS